MAEIRKAGIEDINFMTDGTATTTSAGGVTTKDLYAGNVPCTLGAGLDVRSYGADPTGAADSKAAFDAAIADCYANGFGHVYVPRGKYTISATIAITKRNTAIVGAYGDRNDADQYGAQLQFTGTGPLFEIDVDDSLPNVYDGQQSQRFENIYMKYTGGSTTALSNGIASYGTGTSGITDWKGGHIFMKNVSIENFEYGFRGITSDLNHFINPEINYCKYAVHLYARSDQNDIDHGYFIYNDYAIYGQSSATNNITGLKVRGCTFVGNGTSAIPHIFCDGAWDWFFTDNWFETFSGANDNQLAYFKFSGESGALSSRNIIIRNTSVQSGVPTAVPPGTVNFIEIGDYVVDVVIENIAYEYGLNLTRLVNFIATNGTTSIYMRISWITDSNKGSILTDAGNGGTIYVTCDASPDIQKRYLSSSINRQYNLTTAQAERDYFIGADTDRVFSVQFVNSTTWSATANGRNILHLSRKIHHGSAAPGTGTWEVGDIFLNTGAAAGGTVGWVCTKAGTPGTWKTWGAIAA